MIDAGVGLSTSSDSLQAGRMAAKEALSQLSTTPKLCVLGVDNLTRKKFDYNLVLQGVRDEIGTLPKLIGSTVNGVLVNNRYALKSVGVMLLGGDVDIEGSFNYGKSRLEWAKIANNVNNIRKEIPRKDNQVMLMFQDGVKFPPEIMAQQKMLNNKMVSLLSGLVGRLFKKKLDDFKETGKGMPTVQEIVSELYKLGWDLPIIGNVATNLKEYVSCEFYDSKVYEDAVMGVIMSATNESKFGYGFAAGAEETGLSCQPTKNIGNFLLKIDDKPALEGFCDAVNLEPESLSDLSSDGYLNFYHILGTSEKKREKTYIHLVGTITSPETPNLIVSAFPFDNVPKKAEIFRSNTKILMKTSEDAVKQALENINEPRFFLGIECIVRLLAYGDNYPKAIEIYDDLIGKDTPRMILGSGGEIFANKETDYYFNNFTFITLAGGK